MMLTLNQVLSIFVTFAFVALCFFAARAFSSVRKMGKELRRTLSELRELIKTLNESILNDMPADVPPEQ